MAKPEHLKPSRSISQRLRHRRRDWQWGRQLQREGVFPAEGGTEDPNFPGLAITAIAILPKYHDWCLSMIDSLRGVGNFHGPVYVVTEDPRPFEGLENVLTVKVPYTRYRLVAKSCKQLLLDWVFEPKMLYIDADVVIARPLKPWYDRARVKLDQKPLVLYTCSMPTEGAYHGGLMLADRERVRPFFDQWLKLIRTGRYMFDQESLLSIGSDEDIALFDDDELVFLHQILGEDSEVSTQEAPGTFVHVTNGMIRRYSAAEIKTYLREVVGLRRIPESFGPDA